MHSSPLQRYSPCSMHFKGIIPDGTPTRALFMQIVWRVTPHPLLVPRILRLSLTLSREYLSFRDEPIGEPRCHKTFERPPRRFFVLVGSRFCFHPTANPLFALSLFLQRVARCSVPNFCLRSSYNSPLVQSGGELLNFLVFNIC